jgi:glyoxylase-like metal-dependent hydrolase (beta-lactamase superfamily II)
MEDHVQPGVRKLSDHFFMITLPMPFRLGHVNTYAWINNGGIDLFDTGGNFPGTFSALGKFLEEMNCSVADVRRIFISHFHADHCGLAGLIKEKSGASILMSEIDDEIIGSFEQENKRIEHVRVFCAEQGLNAEMTREICISIGGFREVTYPFRADAFLQDGDVFNLGDKTLRVVATPGHSRGHCSFFIPEDAMLIAGDHLLAHITPNLSPDLLAPSYRPLKSFMASLEKVGFLGVREAYPAHGYPFSGIEGRVDEIKIHHRERKALVLAAFRDRSRMTLEISEEVFGTDLPTFDAYLAVNETYVHLLELEDEGIIRRHREGGKFIFTLA